MKTLPLSEVKMKLSSLVEAVNTADEEILITRNGRPTAVLISAEEFEGLKETLAVRSDEDLMKEIREGIAALKRKRRKLYTLEELLKE